MTNALLLAFAPLCAAQSPMPYSNDAALTSPAPPPAASTAAAVSASTQAAVAVSSGVHVASGEKPKLSRPIRAVIHSEAKDWEPISVKTGGDPGQAQTKAVLLQEKAGKGYKGTPSKAKATARLRKGKNDLWLIYSVFPKALEVRRAHIEVRLRLVEGFVEAVEASLVTVVDRKYTGAGLDTSELSARGVEFEEDSPASGAVTISALDPRPSKTAFNAGSLKQAAFAGKGAGLADVSWAVTGLSGKP